MLWNGYYYDHVTGNYYFRNRYCSPLERRFLTDDPHGINPDGNWNNPFSMLNQYADGFGLKVYANGDPVSGLDGWGLVCGYRVYCRELAIDGVPPWSWYFGIKHCDLRIGEGDKNAAHKKFYSVHRNNMGTLNAGRFSGTPCRCATCEQIIDCVKSAQQHKGHVIGDNCHTATNRALTKCCLMSEWKPSWYGYKD